MSQDSTFAGATTSSPGHDRSVYIVGDVHGQLERLGGILKRANLITPKGDWCGGSSQLWFMGDFMDRGPHSIESVEFAMRLQSDARVAGGQVDALLGNHDLLALAAVRFKGAFLVNHQHNGGDIRDLRRLTPAHMAWLCQRPAMARITDVLLAHADTDAYLKYGRTVAQVNRTVADLMATPDKDRWDDLLVDLSDRNAFDPASPDGPRRLVRMLASFGARRLIHGHSPISYSTGQSPEEVVGPYLYADGRCVNVDGGMYLGGPGFIYRMTSPV